MNKWKTISVITEKKIKDGDRITPAMAKQFSLYVRNFMPINATYSYNLRDNVIQKGIGVSFTENPAASYTFIIDPDRQDEFEELCKRFGKNVAWSKDSKYQFFVADPKEDTKQFVGCRIYY